MGQASQRGQEVLNYCGLSCYCIVAYPVIALWPVLLLHCASFTPSSLNECSIPVIITTVPGSVIVVVIVMTSSPAAPGVATRD